MFLEKRKVAQKHTLGKNLRFFCNFFKSFFPEKKNIPETNFHSLFFS